MVSLFPDHRVEMGPTYEKSQREAQERVKKGVNDNLIDLLLQLRNSKSSDTQVSRGLKVRRTEFGNVLNTLPLWFIHHNNVA
jgi:hypothetical protein